MKATKEKTQFEYHDLLISLGFVHISDCHYSHNLTAGNTFDFSAVSKEGIVFTIFNKGFNIGRKEIQQQIKNVLNI